jgi:preprotein translocase subunit Sec63
MTPHKARIILGVTETASQEEIKQAYRGRIRLTHPDRFPPGSPDWENANKMQRELNEAYDVLKYMTFEEPSAYKWRQEDNSGIRDPKQPLPVLTAIKYWFIIIGPLIMALLLRMGMHPRFAVLLYFIVGPLLVYVHQSAQVSLYQSTARKKN